MNVVALVMCGMAAWTEPDAVLDRPAPQLYFGAKFSHELDKTISASWRGVNLRTILGRISDDRRVSILLDRRIDPDQVLEIDVANQTLLDGLRHIAAAAGGDVRTIASTVYIGPPQSAAKLRTLLRLRSDGLSTGAPPVPPARRVALAARRTFHWNDLDEPRTLLQRIARQHGVDVKEIERIPHDLWASATLPDVGAVEALTLVLIQFDLTFEWIDGAVGIRIVPVPDEVAVEQFFAQRGLDVGQAVQQLKTAIPEAQVEPEGDQIRVRGTVEELSDAIRLLKTKRPRTGRLPAGVTPLKQRQFTLRVQGVAASAVMKKLEESGIEFEYDPRALAAAGIDLETPVDMDVKQATAEQFLRALCVPLGLSFSVEGVTVALQPK